MVFFFFFFNDTATTEIYTLSLHDALPICFFFISSHKKSSYSNFKKNIMSNFCNQSALMVSKSESIIQQDRKSTRLNSSHSQISYAVFCLKKKKIRKYTIYSLIP